MGKSVFLVCFVFAAMSGLCGGAANPLAECELRKLPLGAIRPEGWLRHQLELMTDGICGRLPEYGHYLRPGNGWVSRAETGELDVQEHWDRGTGWEELPYWFRSFVKLAALTGDERLLGIARDHVEKILATRDSDGWYGPRPLKRVPLKGTDRVMQDVWGHMVMNEALLAWYEYSGDRRVLALLSGFIDYCLAIPEGYFLKCDRYELDKAKCGWLPEIQKYRAGDMVSTLFRLYDTTGDAKYVRLADRVWRLWYRKPDRLFLAPHNVNFCQMFSYPGIYARRSRDLALAEESEYWLQQHWSTWGQMPRCAFAADEQFRVRCTDPRYGLETCAWGEYVRSFQNLADWRAEVKWADRTEDVVFNHAPAAYTPDWKRNHYITACNQVNLDARTDHDYYNRPPMVAYSAHAHRCCVYNGAMPFPFFTENLVKRAKDGALYFWMYAPHSGRTDDAEWKLDTRYPFRETAALSITAKRPLTLRFRVPVWAKGFAVGAAAATGRTLDVAVPAGRTELAIAMKAETVFTPWPRQNAVSVDRGPLTYSVAIGERYSTVSRTVRRGGSAEWDEAPADDAPANTVWTEVTPTSPWNYGVDVSSVPEWRECAWSDDCFVSSNAVSEILVTGRRLPEWTLQDNQPARIQLSPAYSAEPLERIRFVPLCCQRLRLSVLPQVTDDPELGNRWEIPPPSTRREDREKPFKGW